jgi:acetyl esterase/lipase
MPFRAAFALPALVLALALAPDLIRPACARTLQAEHPSALPLPSEASPELRKLLAVNPLYGFWKQDPPADAKAWKALAAEQAAKTAPHVEALAGKLGVDVREASLGGARVFELAPKDVDPAMEGRVLLHLHGGGFVFNPGLAGAGEGVMMAAAGRVRVVSVDYRMPPEHPFPAALDDALAVYRALLKDHPASRIGVFGASSGGGLALSLCLKIKAEGLPLPGALAPCSPWSDMDQRGDSYFLNQGRDNVLVSWDPWLKASALLYAQGRPLDHPLLSPVYGDVAGFPPVLILSGTRDLFLSNACRMHLKLRACGVPAELVVFEGMSHVLYLYNYAMPEAKTAFAELADFFRHTLR